MAFMTCHLYSHALYSNITFNISLPTPTSGDRVDYASLGRDFGYDAGLPEVFSRAASMSGALDLVSLLRDQKNVPSPGAFHWDAIFADPDAVEGSGSDLFAQYRTCRDAGCVPELYQACGTEDFLYGMNLKARDRLREMGCEVTWHEGPGAHDWNFWDREIVHVLRWFLQDREKAQTHEIMG